MVNTLVQRALKICDGPLLSKELKHIKNVLVYKNGYPLKWVQSAIKRVISEFRNPQPKQQEDLPRVILPFIKGLTESIARLISRKLGNPIGYIPFTRMADILTSHKDKTPTLNSGVYIIKCSCGYNYIGQTGRDFNERLQEHKRHCRNCDMQSAVSEHVWSNSNDPQQHSILWDNAQIIAKEPNKILRETKESIAIRNASNDGLPLMNRKEERGRGYINKFWSPLLSVLYRFQF